MAAKKIQLSPEQVDSLLFVLCAECGFCLPPGAKNRLRNSPPRKAEKFADVIFECEGMDPKSAQHVKLRKGIVELIAQHLEKAAQEQEPR